MKKNRIIIGLTGPGGAGKGTVADFLVKKGFTYYSCSDVLREELKKRKKEETLKNFITLGNNIRKKFGAGVLGKKIRQIIKKKNLRLVIVDSLRHPDEIKEIKKLGNFTLIMVYAPKRVRYERIRKRKRAEDIISFNAFQAEERFQKIGKGPQANLLKCYPMADIRIVNKSTIKALKEKTIEILKRLEK